MAGICSEEAHSELSKGLGELVSWFEHRLACESCKVFPPGCQALSARTPSSLGALRSAIDSFETLFPESDAGRIRDRALEAWKDYKKGINFEPTDELLITWVIGYLLREENEGQ